MRRLGLTPRKALGQNFLTNESVLDRIADAVISGYEGSEIGILEIGSGPGGLIEYLAQRSSNVVGVEIDELTTQQAEYLDLKVEGPYKADFYRY